MKTKGIMILIGVIAVLAVGGYFTWKHFIKDDAPEDNVTPEPEGDVDKPSGLPRPPLEIKKINLDPALIDVIKTPSFEAIDVSNYLRAHPSPIKNALGGSISYPSI